MNVPDAGVRSCSSPTRPSSTTASTRHSRCSPRGPCTGKTWMIKQCMFLLAYQNHESNDVCSVDGVPSCR